jgi:hypothetical protein
MIFLTHRNLHTDPYVDLCLDLDSDSFANEILNFIQNIKNINKNIKPWEIYECIINKFPEFGKT